MTYGSPLRYSTAVRKITAKMRENDPRLDQRQAWRRLRSVERLGPDSPHYDEVQLALRACVLDAWTQLARVLAPVMRNWLTTTAAAVIHAARVTAQISEDLRAATDRTRRPAWQSPYGPPRRQQRRG